jgi:lipopolysaccharide transport system permease protein
MSDRLRGVLRGYWTALQAREVWTHLGFQDIKNRYKRSLIGPLWIVISMALFVVGLGILFGRIFNQPQGTFIVFLTLGMMLWGLISSSITDGGYAFIGAESYIKQIPFPKQVYIFRVMVVSLTVFSFGLPVFLVVAIYHRLPMGLGTLWALPGMAIVIAGCLAHISIMAYLSVSFRDLPPASASVLQLLYFFTPILYPVSVLRERGLAMVTNLNPFYYLLEVVRYPILNQGHAPLAAYLGATGYVILAWMVALLVATLLDRKIAYTL